MLTAEDELRTYAWEFGQANWVPEGFTDRMEAAEKERGELRARIAELESAIDQFAGRTCEDCPIPELRFALEGPALLTEGKVG